MKNLQKLILNEESNNDKNTINVYNSEEIYLHMYEDKKLEIILPISKASFILSIFVNNVNFFNTSKIDFVNINERLQIYLNISSNIFTNSNKFKTLLLNCFKFKKKYKNISFEFIIEYHHEYNKSLTDLFYSSIDDLSVEEFEEMLETTVFKPNELKFNEYAQLLDNDFIKKRDNKIEEVLLHNENKFYLYKYAKNVIKGRWPEAEEIIIKDVQASYYYTKEIIGGRWIKFEKLLNKTKNLRYKSDYNKFLKSIGEEPMNF